jgi:VanZ family protein
MRKPAGMRFFRYYGPALLWASLILLLTGLPGNYFPKVPTIWDLFEPDKIVHLFIFLILNVLMIYGLSHEKKISAGIFAAISLGTGILFGGITELLQAYVFVWRQASVYDFIADGLGCLAGYFLFKRLIIKKFKSD